MYVWTGWSVDSFIRQKLAMRLTTLRLTGRTVNEPVDFSSETDQNFEEGISGGSLDGFFLSRLPQLLIESIHWDITILYCIGKLQFSALSATSIYSSVVNCWVSMLTYEIAHRLCLTDISGFQPPTHHLTSTTGAHDDRLSCSPTYVRLDRLLCCLRGFHDKPALLLRCLLQVTV